MTSMDFRMLAGFFGNLNTLSLIFDPFFVVLALCRGSCEFGFLEFGLDSVMNGFFIDIPTYYVLLLAANIVGHNISWFCYIYFGKKIIVDV